MQKGVGRGENAHISWHGFGGDTLIPKPQRNAPRVQIFQYMWKLGRLEALSSVWGDSSARRVYPGLPRLRYRFQNKQVLKKEDIHVYFPSRTFWRNRRGQKYTLDSRGWATLDIHSFKHDSSPGGWRDYSSWADVENEPAERLSRWLRSQSRDTRLYILMLYILCLPKGRYYMFSGNNPDKRALIRAIRALGAFGLKSNEDCINFWMCAVQVYLSSKGFVV